MSTAPAFDLWHQPPPTPKPAAAPASPLVGRGIPLRWSQREDVDAIGEALRGGATHPCCIGATGYGKGPLIAELAGRLRKEAGKILCTVDRAHLVGQLADEIERHLGVEVGRVADSSCVGLGQGIVVATVQSLYTPDRKDVPLYAYPQLRDTRAVIVDEGHKFFADTFRSVLDHFADAGAVIPLFTATPVASNGDRWDDFVNWTAAAEGPCMRTVGWCIRNGYLVPMVQAFVNVNLDLSAIYDRLQSGEGSGEEDGVAGDELSESLVNLLRVKDEKAAATFACGIADVIGDRRAIAFTPPRAAGRKDDSPAMLVAAWLTATKRMKCEAVWGGRADKDEVLARFKAGTPQALSNCSLLTEGFNAADVSAIFMCRLLKAWRLMAQCVGRGLRPHPSTTADLNALDEPGQAAERRRVIERSVKPDCLIADLVGLDRKVLQASAIDVLYAGEPEAVRREMAERAHRKEYKPRQGADAEVDEAEAEEARAAVLQRQHNRLAELARQKGMAGGLAADVRVTYSGTAAGDMPSVPTPKAGATLGEKAYFLAVSVGKYDVERAKEIADRTPRNQLKGMGWGMFTGLLKEGNKPDWGRARQAYPEWAAQKNREWQTKRSPA